MRATSAAAQGQAGQWARHCLTGDERGVEATEASACPLAPVDGMAKANRRGWVALAHLHAAHYTLHHYNARVNPAVCGPPAIQARLFPSFHILADFIDALSAASCSRRR